MSIIKQIASKKLTNLIIRTRDFASASASAPPPTNNPPVWDSQPNPVFIEGVAANYSIVDLVSDPDGDSVDVGINSGIVSLPSGVTYNTTLDRLEYDGVGAVVTSTGHVSNASDGIDSTKSDPYSIVITAVSTSGWPAYGAHAQAAYNVANYPLNFEQEPYRTWNSKKDLIIAQQRYPFAAQVAAEVASTNWMRSQNANIKMQRYSFNQLVETVNPNNGNYIKLEAMNDNNAYADWSLYDFDTGIALEYSNEANGTAANPNYEDPGYPAGDIHANFSIAYWNKLASKYGDQWPYDGYFWDSMDYQDVFPRYKLVTDSTTDGNPDYKHWTPSGYTNPDLYRLGQIYDVSQMRAVSGLNLFCTSNGGRDGTAVTDATADNEWAGFWDGRLCENIQGKLDFEAIGNEWQVTSSNPDARIDTFVGAALVSEEMVDKTASNRLGKGVVIIDLVMDWSTGTNPIPDSIESVPQDHYEAARFICGLSTLHDAWVACLAFTRGSYPFPYMDEFVYDPGNPVGGTPTIGSIDNTIGGNRNSGGFPLTMREPDIPAVVGAGQFGIYFQEFDNVLWCVNLSTPDGGGAAWPQSTTDTVTPPSPGAGKVWRFADSTYTNPTRTTGATACENQSPTVNTGGLVGSSFELGRWQARMLVRADS